MISPITTWPMQNFGVGGLTVVINIVVSVICIIVLQLLGMLIFSWMTRFNDMEELKKGNVAVGLAFGGKFMATAIILGISAYTNSSIWHMMLWFAVGYVCLILCLLGIRAGYAGHSNFRASAKGERSDRHSACDGVYRYGLCNQRPDYLGLIAPFSGGEQERALFLRLSLKMMRLRKTTISVIVVLFVVLCSTLAFLLEPETFHHWFNAFIGYLPRWQP